jgi:succinate dehydrogenase / fumarate reductase iron-sulfur subunit
MARNIKLRIWRGDSTDGGLKDVVVEANEGEVVLDVIHRVQATQMGDLAVRWNCKAGKCGSCSMEINGKPRLACMTQVASFGEEETITVTPLRAFPIIKDLMVDRSPFDRIIEAGGYITAVTGGAPDGNLIAVPKPVSDAAMDSAQCIGCGACVAACPNGAASLFTGAKIAHLNRLPQGQPERYQRTEAMVEKMDEYFGSCTNHGECSAACPKEISVDVIALMNKDYRASKFRSRKEISRD